MEAEKTVHNTEQIRSLQEVTESFPEKDHQTGWSSTFLRQYYKDMHVLFHGFGKYCANYVGIKLFRLT